MGMYTILPATQTGQAAAPWIQDRRVWAPGRPVGGHAHWARARLFDLSAKVPLLFRWGTSSPTPSQLPLPGVHPSGLRRTSLLMAASTQHSVVTTSVSDPKESSNSGTSSPPAPPLGITSPQRKEPLPHRSPGVFGRKGRAVIQASPAPQGSWTGAHDRDRLRATPRGRRQCWEFGLGLSQTHPPVTSSHSWSFLQGNESRAERSGG